MPTQVYTERHFRLEKAEIQHDLLDHSKYILQGAAGAFTGKTSSAPSPATSAW